MRALHVLTDAEWAIVGPAVERAQQAQDSVTRLVALFAVALHQRPEDVLLKGRVLYGPATEEAEDG